MGDARKEMKLEKKVTISFQFSTQAQAHLLTQQSEPVRGGVVFRNSLLFGASQTPERVKSFKGGTPFLPPAG